jgi:hypothetical protein
MTRDEALELGYCNHCAAYGKKGWNCGVTLEVKTGGCILPADVQQRFREERGLEGEQLRLQTGDFGDRSLMKKPGRRRK